MCICTYCIFREPSLWQWMNFHKFGKPFEPTCNMLFERAKRGVDKAYTNRRCTERHGNGETKHPG